MFRFDDELLHQLSTIRKNYRFRSISEVAKYCVKLVCEYIIEKDELGDEKDITIEEIFQECIDNSEVFDYIKTKRAINKSQIKTIDEFIEKGGDE